MHRLELTEKELHALMTNGTHSECLTPSGIDYERYFSQMEQVIRGNIGHPLLYVLAGRILCHAPGLDDLTYKPVVVTGTCTDERQFRATLLNNPSEIALSSINALLGQIHVMEKVAATMQGSSMTYFGFLGTMSVYEMTENMPCGFRSGLRLSLTEDDGCVICGNDVQGEWMPAQEVVPYFSGYGYDDLGNIDGLFEEQREGLMKKVLRSFN